MNHILIDGECVLCGGDENSPCKAPIDGDDMIRASVKMGLAEHGWASTMPWGDAAQYIADAVLSTLVRVWEGASEYTITYSDERNRESVKVVYAYGWEIVGHVSGFFSKDGMKRLTVDIKSDLKPSQIIANVLSAHCWNVGLTSKSPISLTAERIAEILKEW